MKACYVHVPFCRDICSYCDFTRCRYHAGLADKWLSIVQEEIHKALHNCNLATLYIGGGTPSALSDTQLETLLMALAPYTTHVKEFTIEVNIDSLTDEKLCIMKLYGVNRISLGVQTLQNELLKIIQRTSNREDAIDAIQRIHEHGIHNISIDLIYGLPHQTMAQWVQDLEDIVHHFDIDHISLYSLTIEEHSQFGRDGIQGAEESLEADMFEYAIVFLQQHGYEHYEISNFSKLGKRSLHNQVYWHYEDFIGIGCGASGKMNHKRYDNTHNLQTYFEQGASPTYTSLTKEEEMFETIMMGLRTKDGISLQRFLSRYEIDLMTHYQDVIYEEIKKGHLCVEGDAIKATHRGMMLLNDVLVNFLSRS